MGMNQEFHSDSSRVVGGMTHLLYVLDRFGYDSAFVGTTIARQSFKTAFNIHKDAAAEISSNITSAFQAGAFFGAIFCYLRTFVACSLI